MLDCDASFVSVPEFASIRRPLPARLKAATALSDGSAEGIATPFSVPSQRTERQNGESFTPAARPAFVESLPAFDMPPIPVPPLADLRSEAARGFSPADLAPADLTPADLAPKSGAQAAPPIPPQVEPDPRPVTPRRPLRFTAARSIEDAAPVALPSFNLFDGVFEDPALAGPDIDPRLQRSRARARAQLATMEAALTPVERNLWHDDDPAPAPAPAAQPAAAQIVTDAAQNKDHNTAQDATLSARPDGTAQPRRPVRHITSADLVRTPRPLPRIEDPLRDRLHDLRGILYTPTEEELAAAANPPRHSQAQRMADLARGMVMLIAGLLLTVLHALPSPARLRLPSLPAGPRLAPRMTLATIALAAVAIPVGIMVPTDLLPFL